MKCPDVTMLQSSVAALKVPNLLLSLVQPAARSTRYRQRHEPQNGVPADDEGAAGNCSARRHFDPPGRTSPAVVGGCSGRREPTTATNSEERAPDFRHHLLPLGAIESRVARAARSSVNAQLSRDEEEQQESDRRTRSGPHMPRRQRRDHLVLRMNRAPDVDRQVDERRRRHAEQREAAAELFRPGAPYCAGAGRRRRSSNSSAMVSRASHSHQTPHAFRRPERSGDEAIAPNSTVISAAETAIRSARCLLKRKIALATPADDAAREHPIPTARGSRRSSEPGPSSIRTARSHHDDGAGEHRAVSGGQRPADTVRIALRHRSDYSVINGSNVHNDNVTNTTSKNISITIHRLAIGSSGGDWPEGAVPRTPAMMTGIGNRIQQDRQHHIARPRARTSIAAKSGPDRANPTVPDKQRRHQQRACEERRVKQKRDQRHRSSSVTIAAGRCLAACPRRSPTVAPARAAAPAACRRIARARTCGRARGCPQTGPRSTECRLRRLQPASPP